MSLMVNQREELAQRALDLPPEDRAYVADLLERSLEADTFATPDIAEAWSKEIDRRIAAYDRGETRSNDPATSHRLLRDMLAASRSAKVS